MKIVNSIISQLKDINVDGETMSRIVLNWGLMSINEVINDVTFQS